MNNSSGIRTSAGPFGIYRVAQLYREDYIDAAVICTLTCCDVFSIGNVQSATYRRHEEINKFEFSRKEQIDRVRNAISTLN